MVTSWDSEDEEKFAELLLYVARRLEDDPAGGAVKLNKVLYLAEFAHVRATGRAITGVEYQKLENGPAPRRLLPVRQRWWRSAKRSPTKPHTSEPQP